MVNNGFEFGDGCATVLPEEVADVFFEPISYSEENGVTDETVTLSSSTVSR